VQQGFNNFVGCAACACAPPIYILKNKKKHCLNNYHKAQTFMRLVTGWTGGLAAKGLTVVGSVLLLPFFCVESTWAIYSSSFSPPKIFGELGASTGDDAALKLTKAEDDFGSKFCASDESCAKGHVARWGHWSDWTAKHPQLFVNKSQKGFVHFEVIFWSSLHSLLTLPNNPLQSSLTVVLSF
jgi:hypothetical protein